MSAKHINLGQPKHGLLGGWARKYVKPVAYSWMTARWICAGNGLPLTNNERELMSLRNKHLGETIVILGNGPSLFTHDLGAIKSVTTIGSNSIVKMVDEIGFEPTYFTIKDKVAAQDLAIEASQLRQSIKLAPLVLRRHLSSKNGFIHFNHEPAYPECNRPFSTDFVRRVACGYSVSYTNMQLAYYLGARKVILIGFDHNYVVPEGANEGDLLLSEGADPNHIGGHIAHKRYWFAPSPSKVERAFEKAKLAYEADGREIVNSTNGGKLNVFRRREYTTALKDV